MKAHAPGALLATVLLLPMAGSAQSGSDLRLLETVENPRADTYFNYFGYSVALSAERLLVGTSQANAGADRAGTAFLFDTQTWEPVLELKNPQPTDTDLFGSAVALSEDHAVVGAYGDDPSGGYVFSGTVYVYETATGTLTHTLRHPEPERRDHFGDAVAVSGRQVLVGVPGDNVGAEDAGSAILFDLDTGEVLQRFENPTPETSDRFGAAVALSGGQALVGAPGMEQQTGEAYLFDAETGALLRTLGNPTPRPYDDFGASVALDNGLALIGAGGDKENDGGSAYVFEAGSGALVHTLSSSQGYEYRSFGSAVAMAGGKAMIGAPGNDRSTPEAASAYFFDVASGTLLTSVDYTTRRVSDSNEISVALSDRLAVVGLSVDDATAKNGGTVFVYAPPDR